ncbi:MAG TPA: GvpL/GvpF family gas vesicle protein [Candidatus Limnocylindrales bacterium]
MTIIWYPYAVTYAENATGFTPPPGIDGVPAQLVPGGGVAAVAAELDAAGFEAAQAEPDLSEGGWLAAALRAHHRVTCEAFARVPVLPLRFGACYASRSQLVGLLEAQGPRLREALDAVRDAAEWTVEVFVESHQPSEVDGAEAADGTAWMRRRLGEAHDRETLRGQASKCAQRVHRVLTELAVRTDGREGITRRVYLVRRQRETAFVTAASGLAAQLPGTHLKLKIIGPQPAFHFVSAGLRHG